MPVGSKKFILFSLALVVFGLAVVNVRPAWAFPVECTPGTCIVQTVGEIKHDIQVSTGAAALSAVIDGGQYFLNKLAYDAAVWLSSGNYNLKGLHITGVTNYLRDVGLDAAGEMIGSFGKDAPFFKKYGINLCAPPDLNIQLSLKLDLLDAFGREPKSRCKFKDIANAYANIASPGYWRKSGLVFGSDSNELAVRNKLLNAVATEAGGPTSAADRAKDKLTLEGKSIPPLSAITNEATRAIVEVDDTRALDSLKTQAADLKLDTIEAEDLLSSGFITAGLKKTAKTFFSTLIPKLVRLGIEKGSEAIIKSFAGQQGAATNPEGQPVYGGREAAQLAFADLLTPTITSEETYDYLSELSQPCDQDTPSVLCGTLDDKLVNALSQAQTQEGPLLTVDQAINKQKLLDPSWHFIDDIKRASANADHRCYTNQFCLTNLKKLRSLRILSIGWEAAAEISGNQPSPATLQEVLAGFNNPNSPYYHLIDPDWVLKAPLARCRTKAPSETLAQKTGSSRREACVDVQTCLTSDANGRCLDDHFGYCRREKNVWRINADSCQAQYNTCATLTSGAGTVASYLTNTLETGVCDASKVGCRAYSSRQNFVPPVGGQNLGGQAAGWTWDVADNAPIIHFTKKAESCGAADEGCAKFIRLAPNLAEADRETHLKKAPLYYNCYGEATAAGDFSSSTLAYWPANKTDLVKLQAAQSAAQKTACQNFASVCTAEEVGCQEYTPKNGNPAIPGVTSEEDQCNPECVGYSTYKQISSFFEPVLPTAPDAHFIAKPVAPGKITQCSAAYVGCDEFVNIGAAAGGGEAKEYYQELRYCSDNESDGADYFTWEGSDTTGYQLKSYFLKGAVGQPPMYRFAVSPAETQARGDCKKENYQSATWRAAHQNSDCREFYDKNGSLSYAIYNQTISVSTTDCVSRRKTVSAGATPVARQANCQNTGGAWQSDGQFCIYKFIRNQSQSCPAAMNGCRAYKGTTGDNIQPFFSETFESTALDSRTHRWFDGQLSTESTAAGGHSLTNRTSTAVNLELATSAKGQYTISFWAKGAVTSQLAVSLIQGDHNNAAAAQSASPVGISNDWHVYQVGPLEISWLPADPNSASSTFRFSSQPTSQFFIDNVVIQRITDNVYVVKDSWTVPPICDNPVPQAQLGCAAYSTRNGDKYLKSFTNLCREEAVGCEALTQINTVNPANLTQSEQSAVKTWNAICHLAEENATTSAQPCQIGSEPPVCFVPPREQQCYFQSDKELTYTNTANSTNILKDNSTIEVLPERRVYLVNDDKFACQSEAVGCSALGQLGFEARSTLNSPLATTTVTVYLKNEPEKYDQTLCSAKFEGCEAYTNTKGSALYFKDPTIFGQAFCEWKNSVKINVSGAEQTYSGWFRKDVGYCAVANLISSLSRPGEIRQCRSDNDCGSNSKCVRPLPCYTNFLSVNTFGIWKNGDRQYQAAPQKMVGLCPADQNSCTEFVDPEDQSEGQHGKSYFLLDNSKLTVIRNGGSDCNGQVSKKKGCILFNDTSRSQRDLTWDSAATYADSAAHNNDLRAPQSTGANNTNEILKVVRDRVCGEWLSCRSSVEEQDPHDGQTKSYCTELVGCQESGAAPGECAKFAPLTNKSPLLISDLQKPDRNVSWAGQDYSGYSILNQVPVEAALDNTNSTPPDNRCRAYPAADSPYYLPIQNQNDRGNWTAINTCAPGEPTNCSCSYRKSSYSGENKTLTTYFAATTPINQKVCDENSGDKIGQRCSTSKDCSPGQCAPSIGACDGGTDAAKTTAPPRKQNDADTALLAGSLCSDDAVCGPNKSKCLPLNSTESKIAKGLRGFCLEDDPTINLPSPQVSTYSIPHPCFNWLPIDKDNFNPDIYNQNVKAGGDFFNALEEINYCAAADVSKVARAGKFCGCIMNNDFGPGTPHENEECVVWGQDGRPQDSSEVNLEYDNITACMTDSFSCGNNYWTIRGGRYGLNIKNDQDHRLTNLHDSREQANLCTQNQVINGKKPWAGNAPQCPTSCILKGATNQAYHFTTLAKALEDDQTLIDGGLQDLRPDNFYSCDKILAKLHELQAYSKAPHPSSINYNQALQTQPKYTFMIPTWDKFFELTGTEDAWNNIFTRNCVVTGIANSNTEASFMAGVRAQISSTNVLKGVTIGSAAGFVVLGAPGALVGGIFGGFFGIGTNTYLEQQSAVVLDSEMSCHNVVTVNQISAASPERVKSFTDRVWREKSPKYRVSYNIDPGNTQYGNAHVTYYTPPAPFGRLVDFDPYRTIPLSNTPLAQPVTYCSNALAHIEENKPFSCFAEGRERPNAIVNPNSGIYYNSRSLLGFTYTYGLSEFPSCYNISQKVGFTDSGNPNCAQKFKDFQSKDSSKCDNWRWRCQGYLTPQGSYGDTCLASGASAENVCAMRDEDCRDCEGKYAGLLNDSTCAVYYQICPPVSVVNNLDICMPQNPSSPYSPCTMNCNFLPHPLNESCIDALHQDVQPTDGLTDRLNKIFAKYYQTYQWNVPPTARNYGVNNFNLQPPDRSQSDGAPPTIVPVIRNPQPREDWANSDADFYGGVTVSSPVGTVPRAGSLTTTENKLTVNLEFYAFAAKNQLPIRRVLVDWGDGSLTGSTSVDNEFLNRRSLCGPANAEFSNIGASPLTRTLASGGRVVDENSQGFGGQKNVTCLDKPFKFTHTYFCQESGPGWDSATGKCLFKPRVQVLDNWGWCNADGDFSTLGGKPGGRWVEDFGIVSPGSIALESPFGACSIGTVGGDSYRNNSSFANFNNTMRFNHSWTKPDIAIQLTPAL